MGQNMEIIYLTLAKTLVNGCTSSIPVRGKGREYDIPVVVKIHWTIHWVINSVEVNVTVLELVHPFGPWIMLLISLPLLVALN